MSWNESLEKKRRGRKRKSDQGSGEDSFPGDLSFMGRRGKRGKRDVTTLEGYTYKETEGCVEIWEKEVKKGIKAKRAKCVGLIRDDKGEERICGKIFGRVPNCKRHVGVHQKSKGRGQAASEKAESEDSFEILDDDEEDNQKGDSSSSEDAAKETVQPSLEVISETPVRQCETCFKWKGSSSDVNAVTGDNCVCSEKKAHQAAAPTSRLFPPTLSLNTSMLPAAAVPSVATNTFGLPLTPPVHDSEIIWASDDDDSKDEFDLSHYLDQKSDDLGGSLTDLIKMEWASFNDVLHFYAVANYH